MVIHTLGWRSFAGASRRHRCLQVGRPVVVANRTSTHSYRSFHVGLTALGNDFSRAYPGFEKDVMGPFTDFLHRAHASKRALWYDGDNTEQHSPSVKGKGD